MARLMGGDAALPAAGTPATARAAASASTEVAWSAEHGSRHAGVPLLPARRPPAGRLYAAARAARGRAVRAGAVGLRTGRTR